MAKKRITKKQFKEEVEQLRQVRGQLPRRSTTIHKNQRRIIIEKINKQEINSEDLGEK